MYQALFEIFKTIQHESHNARLAHVLLEQVMAHTGAEKGFIVVREASDFQETYQVKFDPKLRSENKRHFSRTLVREAITHGKPILSRDVSNDQRFGSIASVATMGPASVLVIPLLHAGAVNAVLYLERNQPPFDSDHLNFAGEFSSLAGLSLHMAIEREALRHFKATRETNLFETFDFGNIIAKHPKMLQLLDMVGRVAPSQATVLITGETGTGKELVAQAIYRNSDRRHKPFVTLHCGALPETLLESELFGHKRGAFTGAVSDRAGRVSIANGGTLFIDEVAEIPLATQAKLLRFFQFGEFQRIGSDRTQKVDVRIVAATHANLAELVEKGQFRADLYYRLKVIELQIPALRERSSDLPILLERFLKRHWPPRKGHPHFTPRALEALYQHPFPGNVRELEHIVERICLLASGPSLDVDLFPPDIHRQKPTQPVGLGLSDEAIQFEHYTNDELKAARTQATKQAANFIERQFLSGLLGRFNGNIKQAAIHAGMQRTYLYKLLAKLEEDKQKWNLLKEPQP